MRRFTFNVDTAHGPRFSVAEVEAPSGTTVTVDGDGDDLQQIVAAALRATADHVEKFGLEEPF